MDLTRRNLALIGAMAIATASLLPDLAAGAETSDEAALRRDLERLRKALLSADKVQLEELTAAQLSYGHSSGKVQNKSEFIDGVLGRKVVVKSLTFPDVTIAVAGNAAIVRHIYASESEAGGKTDNIRLGVLAVWQKQEGAWKLLARQGYKPT